MHAARFRLVSLDAPMALGSFRLNAVSPSGAMKDAGLTWLFDVLRHVAHEGPSRRQ
jgi:hypothetical protein